MITLDIEDQDERERMVLTFKQGRAQWVMFLSDVVREDPDRFGEWLKTLVRDLQYKKGA